jgi:tetratricopeptide (TPR) repeat protein
MKNKRLFSLTIGWIIVVIAGLCVLSLADNDTEANKKAEQYFEKANELRKVADYNAAIVEYEKVISLSPNSKIAQNALYWIGQSYFETGEFDTALSAFKKLLDEYPDSPIIPSTKSMIERVQKAKINESFIWAVIDNDIEQARLLILQKPDVNTKGFDGYPALVYAIWHRNKDMVKLIIDNGADVN